MELKHLEIKGFVYLNEEDVFLEDELPKEDWYYPKNDSIGSVVAEHFSKIVKPFDVSFSDWTTGKLVHYKDVFVQYYVSDKELTWDEAQEAHVKKMAGDLTTQDKLGGYSEWTITESWTEIFVGGHDLREELKTYKDKFVIVRVNYKVF